MGEDIWGAYLETQQPTEPESLYYWEKTPEQREAARQAGLEKVTQDYAKQAAVFAKYGAYDVPESYWYTPGAAPGLTGGQLTNVGKYGRDEWKKAQKNQWGWHVVNNQWKWVQEPNTRPAPNIQDPLVGLKNWQARPQEYMAGDLSEWGGYWSTPKPNDYFGTPESKAGLAKVNKQDMTSNQYVGGQYPDIANQTYWSQDEMAQKAAEQGFSIVDWKVGTPASYNEQAGKWINAVGDRITFGKQDPYTGQWGNFFYSEGATDPNTGKYTTWGLNNPTGENRLAGQELRQPALIAEREAADKAAAAKYSKIQKAWREPGFKMAASQWAGLGEEEKSQVLRWLDEQDIALEDWVADEYTFTLPKEWQDRSFTMSLQDWNALDGKTKRIISQMLDVQGRDINDFVIQQAVPAQPNQPKANVSWGTPKW